VPKADKIPNGVSSDPERGIHASDIPNVLTGKSQVFFLITIGQNLSVKILRKVKVSMN
jgi:hypothetical protein